MVQESGTTISNSSIGSDISTKCGSTSFADGKLPSDVRVGSGSNSTSGSNNNSTLKSAAVEGLRVGALSSGILIAAALII